MSDLSQNNMIIKYKTMGWRLVTVQSVGVLLIAIIIAAVNGWPMGLSLLLGGLAVILPNAAFMLWLFAHIRPSQSQRMLQAFYLGELAKLILMALLLITVFHWLATKPALALVGFMSGIGLYWMTPLFARSNS